MNELVKPTGDTFDHVHEWLGDNHVNMSQLEYSPAHDWIKISLPVQDVERLLDTKYSIYKHEDGDHLVRAPTWSLPMLLHDHVDTIQPTNSFFRPRGKKMSYKTVTPMEKFAQRPMYSLPKLNRTDSAIVAAACNTSAVTPFCLRTLYGTANYTPQAPEKNAIAMTNFLGESSNRSDIRIFLERFRPDAVSAADNFLVNVINGGVDQQTPNTPEQLAVGKGLEGNLDAETILGISYPTPMTAFTTGGMPPFVPDLATRTLVLSLKPLGVPH